MTRDSKYFLMPTDFLGKFAVAIILPPKRMAMNEFYATSLYASRPEIATV